MTRPVLKRAVDFLMTAALLLLMSYSLIGEAVHEWIGMGIFLLFIAHLVLNRKWIGSLGKGQWSAYRSVQTVLATLCFLAMAGLMVSGIILSNYIFADYLAIMGLFIFCGYYGCHLLTRRKKLSLREN